MAGSQLLLTKEIYHAQNCLCNMQVLFLMLMRLLIQPQQEIKLHLEYSCKMRIPITPSSYKWRPRMCFSVLQAKVMGLLLAASVVKALGWNYIFFFSHCETLVEATESRNLIQNPRHWTIRPLLADFCNITSSLSSFKVTHIPRINNLLAHSLAKKGFLMQIILQLLYSMQ